MSREIEPFARLVAALTKLPGVGAKTAQRYAYAIIRMDEKDVEDFADSVLDCKKRIHY